VSEVGIPTKADIDDAAMLAAMAIEAYCGGDDGLEARGKIAMALAVARAEGDAKGRREAVEDRNRAWRGWLNWILPDWSTCDGYDEFPPPDLTDDPAQKHYPADPPATVTLPLAYDAMLQIQGHKLTDGKINGLKARDGSPATEEKPHENAPSSKP
jgi:hypothetical protein